VGEGNGESRGKYTGAVLIKVLRRRTLEEGQWPNATVGYLPLVDWTFQGGVLHANMASELQGFPIEEINYKTSEKEGKTKDPQ